MTHLVDLATCTYFGNSNPALRAIGWLESGHEYTKGLVPKDFVVALVQLAANPWAGVTAGRHACDLCRFSGGPLDVIVGKVRVSIGMSEVFVPADECVYVAPATIVHYIDSHEYQPPEAFQRAVMACPEPGTTRFLHGLMKHELGWIGRGPPPQE
jgi:hypothetical protein